MKRGKLVHTDGIEQPTKDNIRSLSEDDEGYKYLGIVESDDIRHAEMKEIIQSEYYRRVWTILTSKLNGGNTTIAINLRAVLVVCYGAGGINWTKSELQTMERKTQKLLTIYRSLHPQADADRLYMPKKLLRKVVKD